MLDEQSHVTTPNPHHGFGPTAEVCGIHPLNAVAVASVDFMCFTGLELPTGFALAIITVLVGGALVVPCMLVQRYAYKDGWALAFGKALILGILTAIPTALPSALTIAWGVTGAIGLHYRATHAKTIDMNN